VVLLGLIPDFAGAGFGCNSAIATITQHLPGQVIPVGAVFRWESEPVERGIGRNGNWNLPAEKLQILKQMMFWLSWNAGRRRSRQESGGSESRRFGRSIRWITQGVGTR